MLLEKLVALRDRADVDAEIPPAYHKTQKIAWVLALSSDGEFEGWVAHGAIEDTPYQRRSGKAPPPYLLVDQYPYFLGQGVHDGYPDEKARIRWEMFVTLTGSLLDATQDPGERATLEAVMRFLKDDAARELAARQAPPKMKRGDLIALEVGGVFPHRSRSVRQFWLEQQDAQATDDKSPELECLVCGNERPIPATQPIELKLGPERPQLISANENAFESYGLKRATIASVCQECARKYGEALLFLLNGERSHYRAGDVHYVFWTREDEAFDLSAYLNPEPEDVHKLFQGVWSGNPSEAVDPNDFYALGLTTNTSRLVVRDWLETSLSAIVDNLKGWFERQKLRDAYRDEFIAPQGIFALAASTVQNAQRGLTSRHMQALVRAALTNGPLPRDLLVRALRRVSADPDHRFTRPRAVLIRMALNDILPKEHHVPPELDPKNTRPAYLYGRLFATLETIQYQALGSVNATIVDRFYGTASTAPRSVFARLLRGAQPHLAKVRKQNRGAYVRLQERLTELLSHLDGFERTLTLEEQALFAIGYYHERGESIRAAAEHKAQKAASDEAETPQQ